VHYKLFPPLLQGACGAHQARQLHATLHIRRAGQGLPQTLTLYLCVRFASAPLQLNINAVAFSTQLERLMRGDTLSGHVGDTTALFFELRLRN